MPPVWQSRTARMALVGARMLHTQGGTAAADALVLAAQQGDLATMREILDPTAATADEKSALEAEPG